MNLCPWIPLLFLALTTTLPLYAQTPAAGQPSGIMLRVERIYDGENTCVLLNRSGDYRLERYFLHKTNVYVGLLPPQNVQEIQAVLDASPLAQLSQGDIHRDMNSHTFDKLSIDVSRANGTQSLVFFDPESRKPFRESLNPILQWLSKVKTEPGTEIGATSANHCFPGQELPSPSGWSAPTANYLVFLDKEYVWSGGTERGCVIVYRDGRFRSEKTSGAHLSHMSTRVAEGQLSDVQLSELRRTLDDPALAAQRQTSLNPRGFFQDVETTRLAIPRGHDTQQLMFLLADGKMGDRPGYHSGQPPTMNYANPDRHVMDPLQKWIKQNIENQKFASLADDKATECLPSN